MEFVIKNASVENIKSACIVVGIFTDKKLSSAAQRLDKLSAQALTKSIRRGDLAEKIGSTLMLNDLPSIASPRVLLVRCGTELNLNSFKDVIGQVAQVIRGTASKEAVICMSDWPYQPSDWTQQVRSAVEIIEHNHYCFDQLKTEKNTGKKTGLKKVTFLVEQRKQIASGQVGIQQGQAIVLGMNLAKDLGNLPANICTPSYLAKQARNLAQPFKKMKCDVIGEEEMRKLGMGSLLSVAQGSRQPAKLITLQYRGAPRSQKPVVLVGKGVTFDSGGISIKPSPAMDEMKYDMCGAAGVLGATLACASLDLPINLITIVPATENLPDGNASKPGDVVTSMSGQTIEVLNTDAEGRLILCDALTYAEKFKPAAVIDVATLTGACVVALGRHASGLLSNHDALAEALLTAGQNTGDRAWRMPLWEEYQSQLNTNFADMANIGGREAGTITAACFLSRFTQQYHWAHLDIAGTAWLSQGDKKGATGRPVPLLTQYLINYRAK